MANDTSRITRITPSSWFKENAPTILFKVPVYQRLFTWGKSQFDRLLSDLMEWKNNDAKPQQPYYLGIITVVKNEKGQLLLIDGQQRLTVVAILAGMFGWSIDLDDPVNFLDYEARPDDRESLKIIWKNGATWFTKTRTELESKLSAISSDSMREFVLHIFDNKGNWQSLKDAISSSLTLLVSYLPDNYSKDLELQNEYFEKMNSAGRQLEPHEILKVQICKKEDDFKTWNLVEDFTRSFDPNGYVASDVSEEVYFESIIDAEVQEIDKKKTIVMTPNNAKVQVPLVGDENQRTSIEKWRPSLIDFPMFLLHVLKIVKRESDFTIPYDSHNLLKDFKDQLPDEKKSEFCKTMKMYREFLDGWIIHREVNDESDDNDSKYAFWDNKNEVVYIKGQGECEHKDSLAIAKKIKQLQMILFALGGQKQEWLYDAYTEYGRTAMESPQYPKDLNALDWCKWLRNELIKKANFKLDGDKWSDTYLTYGNAPGNARPVHFMCLDYFLWELANESRENWPEHLKCIYGESEIPQAVKIFVPRAHRSVEHFHPRTDDKSQHRGLFADQTDSNSKVKGWGATIDNSPITIKNIFGNLALISAGRNSEYRNMSVAGKSERIDQLVKEGRLESIKLFLMKQACEGHDAQWLPCTAQKHANLMLEVIRWGLSRKI